MARRKTLPESLRAKLDLAERFAILRLELFGERGGPEMARRLGIPVRTWYNYEGGVTVPAEVVLRIIELTSVEPTWLLNGKGPKFRQPSHSDRPGGMAQPNMMVGALLRTALQLLEGDASADVSSTAARLLESENAWQRSPRMIEEEGSSARLSEPDSLCDDLRLRQAGARQDWIEARREERCIQIVDDSMFPVVADGATVAFSREAEHPSALDGKMVVAWVGREPIVRWFQDCGDHGLLLAENVEVRPRQIPIDLDDPSEAPRLRRVLWIEPSQ